MKIFYVRRILPRNGLIRFELDYSDFNDFYNTSWFIKKIHNKCNKFPMVCIKAISLSKFVIKLGVWDLNIVLPSNLDMGYVFGLLLPLIICLNYI